MKFASPLRYPGGKSSLSGFLSDVIDFNGLRGFPYYEPYAGGAGAALTLLKSNVVSEVFINDADQRVYAFWDSALRHTDRFVDRILSIPLTIDEWHQQRDICANPRARNRFEVGFAAFYMNRCNRSGVLTGAGPIGGHKQDGKWRLDVRFNREPLAERIMTLSRSKSRIHLSHQDALEFLKSKLPRGRSRGRVFVYLDPPYVNKGQRLYLNAYDHEDHTLLARYIQSQRILPWIMSYDDTAFVRELYANQQIAHLPIRYSLQEKRSARELILAPRRILLPRACKIGGHTALLSVKRGEQRKP